MTPPPAPVGTRLLAWLPGLALVAAAVGLLPHPIGSAAAVLAVVLVIGATALRLALTVAGWDRRLDRPYLLATSVLVLVMVVGGVLGQLRGGPG